MAITKVAAPNSVPVDISDYVAQNAHIMAFISQVNSQAFILTDPMGTAKPNVAQGAYISHGGSLYVVDSGDEIISGTPADGEVYVKVSGSATLTAEFITDISGFSFSFVNNAFVNGNGDALLPYVIFKDGSDWIKMRYDATGEDLSSVGMVEFFSSLVPPVGWLKCNGASVSRTKYARLFSVIGTTYGGSGSNFKLPDLRGEFLRALDDGRGIDSGRALGSFQDHQMQRHRHTYSTQNWVVGFYVQGTSGSDYQPQSADTGYAGGSDNNSENRPRNVALLACIKY